MVDLNDYYVEQHKQFQQRHKDGINRYDTGELNSLIRYTVNTVTSNTQENLVQALAGQDYQFRQKEAGQRTEQMTAKLLKVIEVNKPDQFVFLGLKEHIFPVTDPEQ